MVKLNLGGGEVTFPGFITVDLREDVADVVADVRSLPFPDESCTHIIAFDLLEHFPADQTDDLLCEWKRVLVYGGELSLKVPNMLELCRLIAMGHHRTELLIRNIYGGHRWGPDGSWDTHHTGWTPDMLRDKLAEHQFVQWENDMELNMTVVAVKC